MRASETLLNEAAWKQPPGGRRLAGRTVARRTDLGSGRGWPGGRRGGRTPFLARTLGLLCEALDPATDITPLASAARPYSTHILENGDGWMEQGEGGIAR